MNHTDETVGVGKGVVAEAVKNSFAVQAEVSEKVSDETKKQLFEVSEGNKKKLEGMVDCFQYAPTYIPSNVDFFDEITNGGLRSGVNVFAGKSGIGKTALATQLTIEMSAAGQPVVYITAGALKREIVCRGLCYLANKHCGYDLDINDITEALKTKTVSKELFDIYTNLCKNLIILDFNDKDSICCPYDLYYMSSMWMPDEPVCSIPDLDTIFSSFKRIYKKAPVFIVDSLQSIALSSGLDSGEQFNRMINDIGRLQLKHDVPILLIYDTPNYNENIFADCYNFKSMTSLILTFEPYIDFYYNERVITDGCERRWQVNYHAPKCMYSKQYIV